MNQMLRFDVIYKAPCKTPAGHLLFKWQQQLNTLTCE